MVWLGIPILNAELFRARRVSDAFPAAAENPFYFLAPDGLLMPLVILATMATVITSQSTISGGAFSITQQATRLGYLPRIRVQHTSDSERGQVYLPSVNWLMLIGVLMLVVGFGSSSSLAAAYGIAVSGAMIINSLMVMLVAIARPNQRLRRVIIGTVMVCSVFEIMFFAST